LLCSRIRQSWHGTVCSWEYVFFRGSWLLCRRRLCEAFCCLHQPPCSKSVCDGQSVSQSVVVSDRYLSLFPVAKAFTSRRSCLVFLSVLLSWWHDRCFCPEPVRCLWYRSHGCTRCAERYCWYVWCRLHVVNVRCRRLRLLFCWSSWSATWWRHGC
jgi:hypothetical protein